MKDFTKKFTSTLLINVESNLFPSQNSNLKNYIRVFFGYCGIPYPSFNEKLDFDTTRDLCWIVAIYLLCWVVLAVGMSARWAKRTKLRRTESSID